MRWDGQLPKGGVDCVKDVASQEGVGITWYYNAGDFDPATSEPLRLYGESCLPKGMVPAAPALDDTCRSTRYILGSRSSSTPLHVHKTDAWNVLAGVGGDESDAPKVRWDCFHPKVASSLHRAIQGLNLHKGSYGRYGDGLKGHVFIQEEDFSVVRTTMESILPGSVVTLMQGIGDVIHVPPGWVHQVYNMAPCVKVACHVYDPTHSHAYALTSRYIASPLFGDAMREDHMAVNDVVLEVLNSWEVA
jgi:JmjC domain, hydroxylase